MRLLSVYTSLALFPSLYISYWFKTQSIATNRYNNIVVPSNQFNLITWCKVMMLSSVDFLEFCDTFQWATICSVFSKGTRCSEAFFRKDFQKLVRREEVVEKKKVIWRISTRGKWRCNLIKRFYLCHLSFREVLIISSMKVGLYMLKSCSAHGRCNN